MVRGTDVFKEYFHDYTEQFAIIGGLACSLIMEEAGLDFRATQDFDIVIIVEAISEEFEKTFWDFIKNGGETIDSRDIKKHKNDIFRLFQLLSPETKVELSAVIKTDMRSFISTVANDDVDLKVLGIKDIDKDSILKSIENIYGLTN